MIRSGDTAPDFELPGTGGRSYRLSEHVGPIVLAMYPGDDTPVCTVQLTAYSTDLEQFTGLGAAVWGISPQSVVSHEAFAEKHGFRFPLLADVDKKVGQAYGILGPLGFYRRSVFVVDDGGIVRYAHRSLVGATYRKSHELVAVLADLGASSS